MMLFQPTARSSVIRTAVFYTPIFAFTIVVALCILLGVWDLGPVLLVLDLGLAVLVGFQSIQSLRDLRTTLRTTRGPVQRIWTKADIPLVSRSHYISVNGTFFSIPADAHFDLKEEVKRMRSAGIEDDYYIEVEVVHYPYTGTVESVKRLGQIPRPQK
jgi:hypothetical protein